MLLVTSRNRLVLLNLAFDHNDRLDSLINFVFTLSAHCLQYLPQISVAAKGATAKVICALTCRIHLGFPNRSPFFRVFSILPEIAEGKELHIFLTDAPSSSPTRRVALTCTVVKAFRPFTLSPVLLVSLAQASSMSPDDQSSFPATAVLKLYDRCCLVNMRDNYHEGKPWSPDKEGEHRQYLGDVATEAVVLGTLRAGLA